MSNKEFILEEILSFEAISRISNMLDQFAEGLKTLGLLKIMRLFPKNFVHLFTYRAISTSDVLNCLHVPENLDAGDDVTLMHLRRFITDSSEEGNCLYLFDMLKLLSTYLLSVLRKFLLYITGSVLPSPIKISFFDEDEYGAISAHTCGKEINFHQIFSNENEETYQILSAALMAVIESKTFNVV